MCAYPCMSSCDDLGVFACMLILVRKRIQNVHISLVPHFLPYFNRYFSYEHFYVIYCKFWELDADHDFLIDKDDLLRYGNHSLTWRIVDRIFSQVFVLTAFASANVSKGGTLSIP